MACLDRDEDTKVFHLDKPKTRDPSGSRGKSVYIMCIYEYESAGERPCGLDRKKKHSRAFRRRKKRKSRK
jgi:hypothetical protein